MACRGVRTSDYRRCLHGTTIKSILTLRKSHAENGNNSEAIKIKNIPKRPGSDYCCGVKTTSATWNDCHLVCAKGETKFANLYFWRAEITYRVLKEMSEISFDWHSAVRAFNTTAEKARTSTGFSLRSTNNEDFESEGIFNVSIFIHCDLRKQLLMF